MSSYIPGVALVGVAAVGDARFLVGERRLHVVDGRGVRVVGGGDDAVAVGFRDAVPVVDARDGGRRAVVLRAPGTVALLGRVPVGVRVGGEAVEVGVRGDARLLVVVALRRTVRPRPVVRLLGHYGGIGVARL
ncbi:hypothetical protein [Halosegnis marinus]|uniref:hypothetical protein n=1 Tax=Halosegnis marinus TaxID=3034023 RepID=UPI00360F0BFD